MDLVLTIPASSAECERGFSHIKRIKTTDRNCLDERSLSDLMTIKLEGPSIEMFNLVPAINAWFSAGHRPRRLMDRKLNKERNTPSTANTQEVVLTEETKQGSSQESATANPIEEKAVDEEAPIQEGEHPLEALGKGNPIPAEDKDDVADSDYESDYETDTDEKFVNNYLKEHELI